MKHIKKDQKNNKLIFGLRSVIEAIQSNKSIEKVFVKNGLRGDLYNELMILIKSKKIVWQTVPIERLQRMTNKNHQGVVALISPVEYQDIVTLVENLILNDKQPFILVLDGITDVRNFGALARTAECAGINAIVIPEKRSVSINADAIKTSAGALYRIPVCRVSNMWYAMKFFKEKGFMIIAASEKSDQYYQTVKYKFPLALVLGAEDRGISSQILKMTDHVVAIPVKGECGSLNVSVAGGILIYKMLENIL